jgi:nitrite reductase (NADH) small subunit
VSGEVRFPLSELEVGGRRQVLLDGREFVVFNTGKVCVAYENRCLHQGGPVCTEGALHPHLSARVEEDGSVVEYFKEGAAALVCPWHGWEYDLDTGQSIAQPALKLTSASVTIEDDTVIVQL